MGVCSETVFTSHDRTIIYIYELTEAVTDAENLHNIESNMSPAQVGKGLMKSYS